MSAEKISDMKYLIALKSDDAIADDEIEILITNQDVIPFIRRRVAIMVLTLKKWEDDRDYVRDERERQEDREREFNLKRAGLTNLVGRF